MRSISVSIFSLSVLASACTAIPVTETGQLKPGPDWVANSSEWRVEAEQVFANAERYISEIEQTKEDGTWGVILDLDETVLNNVAYQVERDLSGTSYSPETWYAWTQREEATLVPGAARFIEFVNANGGHVAFVTNRRDTEQLATERNLDALGLKRSEDFRVFLTRALPNAPRDKDARFAQVPLMLESQGYPGVEIVAYVGDNKGDKPATAGAWEFFCIDQGAMYGEYCADVPGSG